ncbi:MAG TPA: nuclear transport factor 2 family protein [Actinomycetota bacterium]|jgi:ketosteroid isomerase-like protein
MATNGQENLETVLLDYLGAIRTGDDEAIRAVLDPDVTWQGLHEEWVCHGPDDVIETLRQGLELRRDVTALEFIRAGDQVVMGVRGSAIDEVGGESLEGQIFNVFTLRNGRIVRIEDYRSQAQALDSAGVHGDPGWR